ncbi:hypothetical protein J2Z79_000902 [Symbiobacterium terraclitae]|uniref:Polymerase nucleotidyl transferase domain-containing protein n=1 Tax=Symbiobacterium terraclitae TaxID=557451 RepID=A0ABS4JPQ7_9FIRM|nr:nucleotidyltransferase domain-containing protein [Symbiobacterium terraclitae]MBP2017519.1 hypothetical protein [Symbiobacterium terraclitae]
MNRHERALATVLEELQALPGTDAVLFFGSVQRGEGQATSDLDFYVVTSGREYWRAGRVVDGVQVELFFNPAPKMRERLEEGDAVAIHAFATGQLLLDRSGVGKALAARARQLWQEGPKPLTPWQAATWRYRLTDLAQDIEDVPPGSPEAHLLAGLLVPQVLEAFCALNRAWADKPKRLLARIRQLDPELADMAAEFYRTSNPAVAVRIADRVLAPFGGRIHTYESDRVPIGERWRIPFPTARRGWGLKGPSVHGCMSSSVNGKGLSHAGCGYWLKTLPFNLQRPRRRRLIDPPPRVRDSVTALSGLPHGPSGTVPALGRHPMVRI